MHVFLHDFLVHLELCSQVWWSAVSSLWAVHPQELHLKLMERCQELRMTANLIYSLHKGKKNVKSQWFQEHHDPAAASHRLWESQATLSNMKNQGLYQQAFIFPSNQTVQIAPSLLFFTIHIGCLAVTCSVYVCI